MFEFLKLHAYVCSAVFQLCVPMDCSLLGTFVHGIFQARTLEWVAISFSRGSSQPSNLSYICIAGGFSTTELPGKPFGNQWEHDKYYPFSLEAANLEREK